MAPPTSIARTCCSVITQSNRVSSNQSLCCRETEFCRQRQRRRNGSGGPRRPLQRHDRATNPANSALLAQGWEISVSEKVRGGAERTRTPCQARSSIEPVSVTAPMLQARAQSSPLGGEPEPTPLPLYRPP